MWGAKVHQPCDMVLDQLKGVIHYVKDVLKDLAPGTEPTQEMAGKVKEWCDENCDRSWHVVLGRNFGAHVIHQANKFAFFYVGEVAVLLAKT